MKPVTLAGTSLGDGNTACISCAGRVWSCSTGTMWPSTIDSRATYQGSMARPMPARQAARMVDRLLVRSGPWIGTDSSAPPGTCSSQRASPCTLL